MEAESGGEAAPAPAALTETAEAPAETVAAPTAAPAE